MIMVQSPQFVYDVVAMMMFATIGILFYGLVLTKLMIRVLQVPQTVMVPIILVLCTVGSFAISGRLFDVWVMLGFGVLGFILRQLNYPMAPLVLGIVLGDLLEKSLRRGLVLSDGNLEPFFMRPIALVMWVSIALIIAMRFDIVRGLPGRLRAVFAR
jgi:putative tricarboxylic transport membrane protein